MSFTIFLIRHISAHKNLIENPKHRAALLCNPTAGWQAATSCPHSSPLTDHFGTAFNMRFIYLNLLILLFGVKFSLMIIFPQKLPLSLLRMLRMHADYVCTCDLLLGIMSFLCWHCMYVVCSCSVALTLKSGISEASRCHFSTYSVGICECYYIFVSSSAVARLTQTNPIV